MATPFSIVCIDSGHFSFPYIIMPPARSTIFVYVYMNRISIFYNPNKLITNSAFLHPLGPPFTVVFECYCINSTSSTINF